MDTNLSLVFWPSLVRHPHRYSLGKAHFPPCLLSTTAQSHALIAVHTSLLLFLQWLPSQRQCCKLLCPASLSHWAALGGSRGGGHVLWSKSGQSDWGSGEESVLHPGNGWMPREGRSGECNAATEYSCGHLAKLGQTAKLWFVPFSSEDYRDGRR